MRILLLICTVLLVAPPQKITDLEITPSVTGEFDLAKMKGTRLEQLAWSADGNELYLQTYTPDRQALAAQIFHYVLSVSDLTPREVPGRPEWAATYWAWKAGRSAPGNAALAIEVETQKGISTATSLPMGGELARGGADASGAAGASVEGMLDAARQSQNAATYRMRLKGEVIGEWVNHRIMPGYTFGWAPASTGWIAFAKKSGGKLVVMDQDGKKKEFAGTKNVVLPAWSPDGGRLAYLESRGRTKYAVIIAAVNRQA